MEHRTQRLTRTLGLAAAGVFALTTLALSTGPATASRLPADPLTFVGTPAPMATYVLHAQADHVRAAIEDVHAG